MNSREQPPLAPLFGRPPPGRRARERCRASPGLAARVPRAPAARRARVSRAARASVSAVTGPERSSRLRTSSRSAASASVGDCVEQRRAASAATACRQCEAELREPLGADPDRARRRAISTVVARPSARNRSNAARQPRALRLPRRSRAVTSASCSSSGVAACGQASLRTRAIACGSSLPSSAACSAFMKRRVCTASVRRSSAARRRGTRTARRRDLLRERRRLVSSRHSTSTSPVSMRASNRSSAVDVHRLVRQSSSVCATSGDPGSRGRPARFSAHASWSGNTVDSRSSASMRWNCGRHLLAAGNRRTASAMRRVPAPVRRRTSARRAPPASSTSRTVAL